MNDIVALSFQLSQNTAKTNFCLTIMHQIFTCTRSCFWCSELCHWAFSLFLWQYYQALLRLLKSILITDRANLMSLFFCKNLSTLLVCSFFLLNFKITLSSCCKNEADTEICHPDALSRKGLLPSGEDCIDNFQLSASSGSSSSGGHTHRVTGRSDNKKISHLSWPGMTPWGDQLPEGWLRLCCNCI